MCSLRRPCRPLGLPCEQWGAPQSWASGKLEFETARPGRPDGAACRLPHWSVRPAVAGSSLTLLPPRRELCCRDPQSPCTGHRSHLGGLVGLCLHAQGALPL